RPASGAVLAGLVGEFEDLAKTELSAQHLQCRTDVLAPIERRQSLHRPFIHIEGLGNEPEPILIRLLGLGMLAQLANELLELILVSGQAMIGGTKTERLDIGGVLNLVGFLRQRLPVTHVIKDRFKKVRAAGLLSRPACVRQIALDAVKASENYGIKA